MMMEFRPLNLVINGIVWSGSPFFQGGLSWLRVYRPHDASVSPPFHTKYTAAVYLCIDESVILYTADLPLFFMVNDTFIFIS
jgi:hypothetical protein